jgi:hypothetical protein
MLGTDRRGSAMITAITVLTIILFTGSSLVSLGMQALRRSELDVLRVRALSLAEAGAERAIFYLRTQAPDGTRNGSWRTNGLEETIPAQGAYTMVVVNGAGADAGKILITSTGSARNNSGRQIDRIVRVVIKLDRENVSIWNNVIFGGVGQAGRSINGNVKIRGSVHLLGEGEPFTDLDGDGRWDDEEPYTDLNGNGVYDPGEPFVDLDGDGKWDAREPFDDINGNGTRDPPLTVTDLASEFGGTANVGNNYTGMSTDLRALIPTPPIVNFRGEPVQTLNAKMRVKHGRVDVSGTATVGDPHVAGGLPPVKETLDGAFVSDGFGGNQGHSSVYADNGSRTQYDLGNIVRFPTLTESVTHNGTLYPTYMDYLRANALVIPGNLTLQPGQVYGPVSDGNGNSLVVDALGNIVIQGIVYVEGDLTFARNGGNRVMRYTGRGTFASTNNINVSTDLLPATATFPTVHVLGMIARRRMNLANANGDSQLKMAGAFYAQEQIYSEKQNEILGSFVSSHYSMQNVPTIYQVPSLVDNLPPGMPGAGDIWIKTVRVDSWREL